MKNINYLIVLISVTFFGCNFSGNNDNQSVSVKSTDNGYSFEATYPEKKTEKVVAYLEKTLKAEQLFLTASDVKDQEVNLGDSVKFYLKSSPGSIEIDFKKQDNSENAYIKLIDLCKGIKAVLK